MNFRTLSIFALLGFATCTTYGAQKSLSLPKNVQTNASIKPQYIAIGAGALGILGCFGCIKKLNSLTARYNQLRLEHNKYLFKGQAAPETLERVLSSTIKQGDKYAKVLLGLAGVSFICNTIGIYFWAKRHK